MKGGNSMVKRQVEAGANEAYLVIMTATIGGVEWSIYGSMSWTVSQTKKHPWEEIRAAYIEITGDTREEVDHEQAMNVVAGELQKSWAELKGREDLKEGLERNQNKRIKLASESVETVKEKKGKKTKEPKAKKEPKPVPEGKSIPTKGASGTAARLIQEGMRSRVEIVEAVKKAHPDVKNVEPAVSWAARCVGQKLSV
jgi:hypothetical protein